VLTMNKANLFEYFETMIHSSTRSPKFMAISTVRVADIMGVPASQIEQTLHELVNEGKLVKSQMQEPPFSDIYMLPSVSSVS
jgi:hypothetical protein